MAVLIVDPLCEAVTNYLLQTWIDDARLDIPWMMDWAAARGLFHRLASGDYAGRICFGPARCPVFFKWAGSGYGLTMLGRYPSKREKHFYLLPAAGKQDVQVRSRGRSGRFGDDLNTDALFLDEIPEPKNLHLAYVPRLDRGGYGKLGTLDLLTYHFPSDRQKREFERRLEMEQAAIKAGDVEPGTCAHVVWRKYVTFDYPKGQDTLFTCNDQVASGSVYCVRHQPWIELQLKMG